MMMMSTMNATRPGPPDRAALLAQARRFLHQGRPRDAERCCVQLLSQDPNDVEAITIHSGAAVQVGAMEEAERMAERCVLLAPKSAMHWFNLAKIRSMMGRTEEALADYEKALNFNPNLQMALAGKADALNMAGRRDEAVAVLEPHVKRLHDSPDMGLVYATLMNQRDRHAEAVATCRRHLLSKVAMPDVIQGRLNQVLGKAHGELGAFAEAFEAYKQANAVRARSARFSIEEATKKVDDLISFFSPSKLKQLSHATQPSDVPVFIVGMPRSGTTLIEQIICSHPQGHGAGELTELDRIWMRAPAELGVAKPMPEALADMPGAAADRLAQQYLSSALRGAKPGVTRSVDKYLRNSYLLGLAWMLFPTAHVIFCNRNPMDTCFSCYISELSPVVHGWCTDLTNLGRFYNLHERLLKHWKATLPMKMLDVRYEDVVADQEGWTRKILDFLGLPWDESSLRFHENKRVVRTLSYDQVRRPIYKKAVDRWRNYEQFLGPLRDALNEGASTAAGA